MVTYRWHALRGRCKLFALCGIIIIIRYYFWDLNQETGSEIRDIFLQILVLCVQEILGSRIVTYQTVAIPFPEFTVI